MRAHPTYLLIRGLASFAAATAFTFNLVYQIETVGLSPLRLILVGTVLETTALLTQVPTGIIADLHSRRLSVVLGYLLVGAGMLLSGLVPTFFAVLVGNVIWGVGITCVDGAEEAWAAEEIGEQRAADAFIRGAQVGQAATALGIGASIGLASIRLNLGIVVGSCVWLLLGALLLIVMPERHFQPVEPSTSFAAMRAHAIGGVRAARTRPVLLMIIVGVVCLGLSSEGIDRLTQAHFLTDVGFPGIGTPVLWLGVLSVVGMTGSIVVTGVVRMLVKSRSPGGLFVALQAICVVGAAAFALAGVFWLAAAATLVSGMAGAAARPLLTTWIVAHSDTSTRATVFSLVGLADASGQIAGGPPVGVIANRSSIRLGLLVSALLLVPAVASFSRAHRRERAAILR